MTSHQVVSQTSGTVYVPRIHVPTEPGVLATFDCTCPGYEYWRDPVAVVAKCKHVRALAKLHGLEPGPASKTWQTPTTEDGT